MPNEYEHLPQAETESRLMTFKEILFKYISNLPLFFFSLGVALIISWAYLRWSTPVYTVYSSMIVKVENATNIKGNDKFSSIFNPTDKINTEDEIDLMRSKEFLKRVVDTLKLNSTYIEHGKVRSSEIYGYTPFIVEPVRIGDSARGYTFDIELIDGSQFRICL
jgi:tyrosine-protein kinase Etk/Wzc